MNVVVLFGGNSVEHEISIITGIQVLKSIDKKKYNVIPVYLTKANKFMIGKNFDCIETFTRDDIISEEIIITQSGLKKRGKISKEIPVDVFVCAFHGYGVESGEISGFLDILDIPYTSCGVMGASLGQDKIIMKKVLQSSDIPFVPYLYYDEDEWVEKRDYILQEIGAFGYPIIVKPSNLGSSIGIKIASSEEEAILALRNGFKYDKRILIERALEDYREFNCAICGKVLSSVEEVITENDFLTFQDKYESQKSSHILPAEITSDLEAEILKLTKDTYKTLLCEGVARIDFLYDNIENKVYVNEINTIPGALAYYLFEDKGIYFDELLDKLIDQAFIKHHQKKKLITSFISNALNQKGQKNKNR